MDAVLREHLAELGRLSDEAAGLAALRPVEDAFQAVLSFPWPVVAMLNGVV